MTQPRGAATSEGKQTPRRSRGWRRSRQRGGGEAPARGDTTYKDMAAPTSAASSPAPCQVPPQGYGHLGPAGQRPSPGMLLEGTFTQTQQHPSNSHLCVLGHISAGQPNSPQQCRTAELPSQRASPSAAAPKNLGLGIWVPALALIQESSQEELLPPHISYNFEEVVGRLLASGSCLLAASHVAPAPRDDPGLILHCHHCKSMGREGTSSISSQSWCAWI